MGNGAVGVSNLDHCHLNEQGLHRWVLLHFCLFARGSRLESVKLEASVGFVYLGTILLLLQVCEPVILRSGCVGRELDAGIRSVELDL